MASFSGFGIGLSLASGFLVVALVAELFYLLRRKKKAINTDVEQVPQKEEDNSSKYATELFHLICWKKPNSTDRSSDQVETQFEEQDLELGESKDLLIKAFNGDESIESELMRLHNLSGPPRFLFTIKEETKEDLESEKGSRTTSFSDVIFTADSPILKSPKLESFRHNGFNPQFESSMESEISWLRSSPPPKFKFLRDAEDKLLRKLMEEAEKKGSRNCNGNSTAENKAALLLTAETEGSFLGFIVNKSNERGPDCDFFNQLPSAISSHSRVLPLASSPTTFRPLDKKRSDVN